jgi:GT2 family glycosyltransferase
MINRRYELRDLPQKTTVDVPSLSGCFLLMRSDVFRRIKGFDERYFMYLEDVDLVRRIGDIARTVFDPHVTVTHAYGKGSYRSFKLLSYHTKSAITYFFKWGWFFDQARRTRNKIVLEKLHVPATEEAEDITTSLV